MNHLTQLEKMTLLEALILAIGHNESVEEKKRFMELVRKVKAFLN